MLRRRRDRKKRLLLGPMCVSVVVLIGLIGLSIIQTTSGNELLETQTTEAAVESDDSSDLVSQAQYRTEAAEGDETAEPTEEEELPPEETEPVEDETLPYLSDEVPLDDDTQTQVMYWCEEYGVPYSLALAVIEAESSFQPDAENGNCYGYMQINSINLDRLGEAIGITDLKDPHQNLQAGIYMLSDLYGKYGDWNKALTAYNFGEAGAYKYVFSQGLTSSSYSRHVLDLEAKWAEVILH